METRLKQMIETKSFTESTCRINSIGDLMMDGTLKHIIGKECNIVKVTKGGMILVEHNGKQYSVPPKNIELI